MKEKIEMECKSNAKKINVVHMFPKLLSLYGEYGNVSILNKYLTGSGFDVNVIDYEEGQFPDLAEVSLVYVGSGTEENIIEAISRLEDSKEIIREAICIDGDGPFWLSTGNSMCLFGKTITWKGSTYQGLEAFSYESELSSEQRFASDVVTSDDNIFGRQLVGFINTSTTITGIDSPLLTYSLGKNMGNDKKSDREGLLKDNFWGTQLVGPLLVKNPPALEKILSIISGENFKISDDENIVKAYSSAVSELNARAR